MEKEKECESDCPQEEQSISREKVQKCIEMLTYGCAVSHFPNDPCRYDIVHTVRLYLHSFDPTKLMVVNFHKLSMGEQQVNLMNLKRVSTLSHCPVLVRGEKVGIIRLVFEDASCFTLGVRSKTHHARLVSFFEAFCLATRNHPARL